MNATEMWYEFCADDPTLANAPHEAWAFGCEPDLLAKLVLHGQKNSYYIFLSLICFRK